MEEKFVDEKDLIAFLCKLNLILIASTAMKKKEANFILLFSLFSLFFLVNFYFFVSK
jgi:uncharacterized protein YybS (DUF2232 family)